MRRLLVMLVILASASGCPRTPPPGEPVPVADLAACLAPEVATAVGFELALPAALGVTSGTACVDPRPCIAAHGAPALDALADGTTLRRTLDRVLAADEVLVRIPAANACGAAWRDALTPSLASLGLSVVDALGTPGGAVVCAEWAVPDLSGCAP